MNTIHQIISIRVRSLLLFALFTLLPVSCSLDEHPKDQIEEELAHGNREMLFKNTVSTLYNYVGGATDGQGLQGTCRGIYDLQTFGSDEAMLPTRGHDWYDGELWQHMYRHSWDGGHDLLYNSWTYLYKAITLCNRSIEHLAECHNLITDYEYKAYTAEVRALRAIYYWYLLDLFGRVPIFTATTLSMNDVHQSERSDLFHFVYDEAYLSRPDAAPVSPTMPLTNQQYDKEMMFPVFDGLIPEGWLLDIASSSWKIDPRDRMSLLMACCKDCIGNISVKPLDHE